MVEPKSAQKKNVLDCGSCGLQYNSHLLQLQCGLIFACEPLILPEFDVRYRLWMTETFKNMGWWERDGIELGFRSSKQI